MKIIINNYASKTKTSILAGTVQELSLIKKIEKRYDYVIQDAHIYIDSDNAYKKTMFLLEENINEEVLKLLKRALSTAKASADVFIIKHLNEEVFLYDGNKSVSLKEKFNFTGYKNKVTELNTIDIEKNIELIKKLNKKEQEKYISKTSIVEFLSSFNIPGYKLNIDAIGVGSNNDITFLEMKSRNIRGYDDKMNIGEYSMYRDIQNNGYKIVLYTCRNYADKEWYFSNPYFYSWDKIKDNPSLQQEQSKKTSFYGNKTQKTNTMKIDSYKKVE